MGHPSQSLLNQEVQYKNPWFDARRPARIRQAGEMARGLNILLTLAALVTLFLLVQVLALESSLIEDAAPYHQTLVGLSALPWLMVGVVCARARDLAAGETVGTRRAGRFRITAMHLINGAGCVGAFYWGARETAAPLLKLATLLLSAFPFVAITYGAWLVNPRLRLTELPAKAIHRAYFALAIPMALTGGVILALAMIRTAPPQPPPVPTVPSLPQEGPLQSRRAAPRQGGAVFVAARSAAPSHVH